MFVELAISIGLLGVLLVGLSISLDGYRRFNHYQLTRQQCICAAVAQLDSITATGGEIGAEKFAQLWPDVEVSVGKSQGDGQWRGLTLVEVTTTAQSITKRVEIRQSRYISNDNSEGDSK